MTDQQTLATHPTGAAIVRNPKTRKLTFIAPDGTNDGHLTVAEAANVVRSWLTFEPKRTKTTTGVSVAFDKLIEQYLSTAVRQPGPVYKPRPRQRPLSAHQRRRKAAKRAKLSRRLNRR